MVILVFLGLPAAFVGATATFYALAALLESVFHGGAGVMNSLTLMVLMLMVFAGLLTLAERKWSGAMQDRIGPNRANIGPFRWGGLPHFLADALKMIFKEDFSPERASKFLFHIAPALVFVPAVLLFAVVPVAPPITTDLHGLLKTPVTVALQVAAPDFGVLFIFAFASLAVYGTTIAGWASNNKLALLGAVRASSQMIGYEVALGLSLVGTMLAFSTVRLDSMSSLQGSWLWGGRGAFDIGLPAWGIFLQPVGFLLFFAAAFAETKRAPFDMPEGESEIVGYFVEYSGLKFGLFMISEFVEVVVLSGVITAIFLGGYHLPFGERWLESQIGPFWLAAVQGASFWFKVLVMCWLQLTVRWTFPRFRYDQVQKLCWKMLLPLGLANVFVSGALVLLDKGDLKLLAIAGLIEIAAMVALVAIKPKGATETAQPEPAAHGHATGH
ncbi:MAG: NADH-quinone oxidoreductase subunit H [Myxococcales bacterium]